MPEFKLNLDADFKPRGIPKPKVKPPKVTLETVKWVVIAALAVVIAWLLVSRLSYGGGFSSSPAESSARQYLRSYGNGLSAIYSSAADKSQSGEFEDLEDARKFISSQLDLNSANAFKQLSPVIETLNGKSWSNESATQRFKSIAKGLRRE